MDKLAALLQVKKAYQKPLLNVDQFSILKGQCTMITGDNGSGKSTLLKIINGLVSADSGYIDYLDKRFAAKERHLLSKNSTYLSSDPYLFDCSVEKNIAYPLWLKQPFLRRTAAMQNKIDEILHWGQLDTLKTRHPSRLSSGERQKVALARARMLNPQLWLLDEPTDNLDSSARNQLFSFLHNLLAEGCSIIIVTHHLAYFSHIAHQHWHICQGKLSHA